MESLPAQNRVDNGKGVYRMIDRVQVVIQASPLCVVRNEPAK